MSTAEYIPNPGSVADRALAHLHSLPPRAELSTAALAEAINVAPQAICACLRPAIDAGAIHMRKKGGHVRSPAFWSLHDHSAFNRAPPTLDTLADLADDAGMTVSVKLTPKAQPDIEPDGPRPTECARPAPTTHLLGRNATISLTGEVAIVSECGTVILFDAARGARLRAFFAGSAA